MKLRIVYAVRAAGVFSLFGSGDWGMRWLMDTCAGGAWSSSCRGAVTFGSEQEALDALAAADITSYDETPLEVVRLVEKETC